MNPITKTNDYSEMRRELDARGFLRLPGIFNTDQVVDFRNKLNAFRDSRPEADKVPTQSHLVSLHNDFPLVLEFLFSSRLIEFLQGLGCADPVLVQSMGMFYGSQAPMHVDRAFYATNNLASELYTWTALEDVHMDAGPVYVVPGSHLWPEVTAGYVERSHLGWLEKVNKSMTRGSWSAERAQLLMEAMDLLAGDAERHMRQLDLKRAPISLKMGDVLLFRSSLLHGAMPRRNLTLSRAGLVGYFIDSQSRMRTVDSFFLPRKFGFLENEYIQSSLRPFRSHWYMSFGATTFDHCEKIDRGDAK